MIKKIWSLWKSFAQKVGNFQARIILSILYFLIVTPIGLFIRLFRDPLRLKERSNSYWLPVEDQTIDLDNTKRQY
jgi:hypothetical protein